MALKKYWIIILLFAGSLKAQNLFFTDSYQTSLYTFSKAQFVFNNDIFSMMNASHQDEVKNIFTTYFESLDIQVNQVKTSNTSQLAFEYKALEDQPLEWSKIWHQQYESKLKLLLNQFLQNYYNSSLDYPTSIKDAAIKKQAYYSIRNYKNRVSAYSNTCLNISLVDLNVKKFEEENIAPNLSLNRIITSSFYNYFNEAYVVKDQKKSSFFILGPNSKSRMTDCLSMHLYAKLNQLSKPIYLSSNSVLVLDSLHEFRSIDESTLKTLMPLVKSELLEIMNSLNYSFYNVFDKVSLDAVSETYSLEEYESFINIYVNQNSYNVAHSLSNADLCFNKAIIEETVNFKINSHYIHGKTDTLILNTLALFFLNNPLEGSIILGFSGEEEYTKIDKKKYLSLLDKYKEFTPVKSSKRADLSIYRAVVVFDYLVSSGVNPRMLICMSKNYKGNENKSSIVKFTFR